MEVDGCVLKFFEMQILEHEKDIKSGDPLIFKLAEEIVKKFENNPYEFYRDEVSNFFFDKSIKEVEKNFFYIHGA